MKIAFDNQIFSLQQYGGISRYFIKLIKELNSMEVETKIFSPLHHNNYLKEIDNINKFGKYLNDYPYKTYRLINIFSKYFSNYMIKKWKPDIIHETYYSKIKFNSKKIIKVITVYDMIHEVFLGKYFNNNDPNIKKKFESINRADHIIAISENTKKDLIKFFPKIANKVTVIMLGFEPVQEINYSTEMINQKPYILYVGDRHKIKNFNNFIKAYSNSEFLKNNYEIVFFGNNRFTNEENILFKNLQILDKVKFISGNDYVLSNCYSQAKLFIYPSLYEGFGLPLLEAMGHKCPVVCSNTSSMPEVAEDAAYYFDPYSIENIQSSIEKVLKNNELKDHLIHKGLSQCKKFSWHKNATETLHLYKKLINENI